VRPLVKASPSAKLRQLLAKQPYIATTGIFTPIQARIAERVGLSTAYVSGYSCSLGYLVRPDLGFVTLSEMVGWTRMITSAVNIPIVADADDGYGGPLQAARTVEEFERAGVAAINLEDQVFPKRCGHLPGKSCVPIDQAVAKIKAAVGARSDPTFTIIARTDIITRSGARIDEAIERSKRYAGVGADMVWAEFPTPSRSLAESFAEGVHRSFPGLPLFFNYSSSFRWNREPEPMTFRELGDMGYRFIVVGLGAIHAGMLGEWTFMSDFLAHEEQAQWRLEKQLASHPTEDHHAFARWAHFEELEASYYRDDAGARTAPRSNDEE
jgi:isocitrate lyase